MYFSRTHRDEDAAVILLADIRRVFYDRAADRLASAVLVAELIGMDDALWADWRGLRDDQQPRRLSQGELARLLAPFGIRPRTIWPQRRNQKDQKPKRLSAITVHDGVAVRTATKPARRHNPANPAACVATRPARTTEQCRLCRHTAHQEGELR